MDGEELSDDLGDDEDAPIESNDEPQNETTDAQGEDVPQDTDSEPESEAPAAKPKRARVTKKTTTTRKTTRKKAAE